MEARILNSNVSRLNSRDLLSKLELETEGRCRASLYKDIEKLISEGNILRVARGQYVIPSEMRVVYHHEYSEIPQAVAEKMISEFPSLDFRITELIQFNEFVNHQIAHNAVFVHVEKGTEDFVFEQLKEIYPGKVLLRPDLETYHRYWCDDMIVIGRLISQTPKGDGVYWHASGEKLLVDIFADFLISSAIPESEWATVYTEMFSTYAINESRLFRYAGRRGCAERIRQFIEKRTSLHMFAKE